MAFKEFRQLEDYIGKYRVLAHFDEDLGDFPRDEHEKIDESYDDLYIKCKRGEIRHTYRRVKDKIILCWYTPSNTQGKNVLKKIKEKYPNIWIEQDEDINNTTSDFLIYFEASDIEKIDEFVDIIKSGTKIRPFSNKNLPKTPYDIPEKDLKKMDKVIDDLDLTQKMQFMRYCMKEFDEIIKSKKGKKYDVNAERKKSKLKPKAFIHSIGMWDEFVEFCKDKKQELKETE